MNKVLIKLRRPPEKVKRRRIKITWNLDDGDTFKSVMDGLGCTDPSLIDIVHEYDYENTQITAVHERMQTDEEWDLEFDRWRKKRKIYDDWYAANSELIREETQRRIKEAVEQEELAKKKAQKRLKKELAKLEKGIG